MSMTLCHRCDELCDTDAYPEGYYADNGQAEEPRDFYLCHRCNEEE